MELDGVHAMVYGTYYQSEHFYLDGLLKVGKNDFTTQRRLGSRAKPLQAAYADTEGMDYSASLNGGFEFSQGPFSFGPYGRLSFTRAEIDAYAESVSDPKGKGAGSVVSISDQTIDSTTAAAGGQLSWAISLSNSVLIPQTRFEWEHEFSDESREVSAQFIHDPSSSTFSITTDRPDQDFLNIGVGFSIVTAEGRSGFIDYETRIGQDNISSNWVKAGVRLEF
jgi:outer membrane autotransporter protein